MDDTSDVEAVETEEKDDNTPFDESDDRPIMQLFQRLISNDNQQNTVLTNAQIIDILHKEFDIDIMLFHELQTDIYLTVMKKYLKDWPQWDDFDRVIRGLKNAKAYSSIRMILNKKYKNLKEYLKKMLETTEKLAQESVDSLKEETKQSEDEECEKQDVLLEVYCSREQLNSLILRRPEPGDNNNIFHYVNKVPTSIVFHAYTLKSILYWNNLSININMPNFAYKRTVFFDSDLMLVNKVLRHNTLKDKTLNLDLQYQQCVQVLRSQEKSDLNGYFNLIRTIYKLEPQIESILKDVFQIILHDFRDVSTIWNLTYKRYLNKYKYVRYLGTDNTADVASDSQNYDLHLQETAGPYAIFCFTKMVNFDGALPPFSSWFNIECNMCKTKFYGDLNLIDNLRNHMNEKHLLETDWQCVSCSKKFPAVMLSDMGWTHKC